jgi:hypothetical protein
LPGVGCNWRNAHADGFGRRKRNGLEI